MTLSRLILSQRLSAVSWLSIEAFISAGAFLLPFEKFTAKILLTIGAVLWAVRKISCWEPLPALRLCHISYSLFILTILLSFINLPRDLTVPGISAFLRWTQNLAVFYACADLFSDQKRLFRFLFVFMLSMTVVVLNGYYQILNGEDLIRKISVDIPGRFVRMRSSFKSPNEMAAFLLFGVPLAFALWYREKRWTIKSSAFVAMLALFSVAFFATLTRSTFLGLIVGLAALAIFRGNKKILWFMPIIPLFLATSETLRSNFLNSLHWKNVTIGERADLWKVAITMIKEHPWIGNGLKMYRHELHSVADRLGLDRIAGFNGDAHNCYLQIWSETGFFSLLFFIIPFYLLIKNKTSNNDGDLSPIRQALWIGVIATLVQASMDTNFYDTQTSFLFWIFWGGYLSLGKPWTDSSAKL